jgi:hypothetical protein
LRVLKPGGHLLAFGGTRTWHRLASAIEDAGFEIRDSMAGSMARIPEKPERLESLDGARCRCPWENLLMAQANDGESESRSA